MPENGDGIGRLLKHYNGLTKTTDFVEFIAFVVYFHVAS